MFQLFSSAGTRWYTDTPKKKEEMNHFASEERVEKR